MNKIIAEKTICFVIMPFGGICDLYYEKIYAPAIKDAGLKPIRADEIYSTGRIIDDIWKYTKQARLIIADLTGRNPNVLYELGLAHAIGKQAILITESAADIPFDLRALRHLIYDKNMPDWGVQLQSKIISSIQYILNSPHESVLPTFLNVEDLPEKSSISKQELEFYEIRSLLESILFEIDRNRPDFYFHLKSELQRKSAETDFLPKKMNVNSSINEVIALLKNFKGHNQIEVNYATDVPILLFSPFKFMQILLNVVVNALESLSDDQKKVKITTLYDKSANQVIIMITDEGKGMNKEILNRATAPFFSTKRNKEDGSGLGLTVANAMIKEYGGTIEIDSKLGIGTTVIMRLPANSESPSLPL